MAKNKHGQDSWVYHAKTISDVMQEYIDNVSVNDPVVYEAFANFTHGNAVEPSSVDKNRILLLPNNRPNGKYSMIPHKRTYTFVTIPVHILRSRFEESKWLLGTCKKITRALRHMLRSEEFEKIIKNTKESSNYTTRLFDDGKSENLLTYLNKALVKVTLGGSLTDHVTQSVSNEIMMHLWQNRQNCTKYDFEDQAKKSYNDTWNDAKDDSIGLMHKNNTSSDDSDTKCGSDLFDDQTDESENCSENNYGNNSGAEKGRDVKGSYNNTKTRKNDMDSNKRSISHNILSPAQEHRKGNDCQTNTPEKYKKHHVQEKRSTETTKKTNDSGDNQHRFFYFKMMNDMQDAYIIGRKMLFVINRSMHT